MAETKRTLLERLDRTVQENNRFLRALLSIFPVKLRLLFGQPETRTNLPQGTPHMAQTLTDIQRVSVTLEADDAAGNAVAFDFPTPPTWASSDDSIVTVSPSADGSNASVVTTGKLGNAQITVSGTTASGVSRIE
jgi:hypothetical protein